MTQKNIYISAPLAPMHHNTLHYILDFNSFNFVFVFFIVLNSLDTVCLIYVFIYFC